MKIIERVKLSLEKIDRKKSIVFLLPILFFLVISFFVIYADTPAQNEIEINSNYSSEGSWTINKKAEWIGQNKARVTIEVESQLKMPSRNRDVILVIDTSDSMGGSRLDKVKEDTKELVSTLLSDSNNRVALISFGNSATKLSNLTNNASDINDLIDSLTVSGNTNYNAGLLEAKGIIENYTQVNNKDLVVLFLTDGYPNENTPNQISTYQILKAEYPFVNISAVQYEMGNEVIDDIASMSDNQYIANMETLSNVLIEVCLSPVKYESFKVEDYISENYEIESIGDIKSSIGTTNLTTVSGLQRVLWNLGGNYTTGTKETLKIDIVLKEELRSLDDTFETNDHEVITTKLPSDSERVVNSNQSPLLDTKYTVVYQTNTPSGCTLSNIASVKYNPYVNITIRNDNLECNGYIFRGYEIEQRDVQKINSNTFIMPGHDVVVRAIWSKVDLSQTMDGEVSTGLTFYKIIKNEYLTNSGYAALYTGNHKDSYDRQATKKIYYYKTTTNNEEQGNILLDKINVIFGGYCWQMYRTTDTGGVKMIYNGIPVDGKCLNTRSDVNGLNQTDRVKTNISGDYYYGSEYTYNLNAGTFKLAGTTKSTNYVNDKSVIGMYTCLNTDVNATCSTLYYIQAESDTNTSPFTYPIKITTKDYHTIGNSIFNSQHTSLAHVGYMYNDETLFYGTRATTEASLTNTKKFLSSTTLTTNFYYSDSIDIGNTNLNQYTLINPVKWEEGVTNLAGKYAMNNAQNATNVYYIEAVVGTTMYYRQFSNGNINTAYYYGDSFSYKDVGDGSYKYVINNATQWTNGIDVTGKYLTYGVDNTTLYYIVGMVGNRIYYETVTNGDMAFYNESIVFGDSIIENQDGTYSLDSTTPVSLLNYSSNYANYVYKYTCGNSSTTCYNPRYIVSTTDKEYKVIYANEKILLAKSRNGLNLSDTLIVSIDNLSKNRANYSDYKYACTTINSTCNDNDIRMITSYQETRYIYVGNRYFGSSATWDGTKYTLTNVLPMEYTTSSADIATHHYTCLDFGATECSSVAYIYKYNINASSPVNINYVFLENGSINPAAYLNKVLFANDVNAKDSPIKRFVEMWYKNSLVDYDAYLEETIYCGDRSISSLGGWDYTNPTSWNINFKSNNGDLSCEKETDQFSVSNSKARIKYKVGLATTPEMLLFNNTTVKKTSTAFHLMNMDHFDDYDIFSDSVSNGTVTTGKVFHNLGVRPVISLNPLVGPESGSGTMADPYIVDTSGN